MNIRLNLISSYYFFFVDQISFTARYADSLANMLWAATRESSALWQHRGTVMIPYYKQTVYITFCYVI